MPGTDVSSAVDTDKENASMTSGDEEDNDNTNQLLDSTFELKPKAAKLNFSGSPATLGSRSPLKPIFKTPLVATGRSSADLFAMDSDVDSTPTNRPKSEKKNEGSYFSSPQF